MDLELPILIFLVTFAVEALGWIGKDSITEFFYGISLFFSSTPLAKQQRALKTLILKERAELAATSSQNEFAKWAKLRRKLDKGVADLEALNAQAMGSKAAFASVFKKALWVLMTALPFIFSSWHRKSAVFYLPPGWFGPASWYLGLPSAPASAISVTLFTMATKRTISCVKDAVVDIVRGDPAKVLNDPIEVVEKPVTEGKSEL